jgi:hypothetical protein
MVLLSSKEDELAVMVINKVSTGLGLRINTSKTKVMAIPRHVKGAGTGMEEVEAGKGLKSMRAWLNYLLSSSTSAVS